MTPPLDQKTPHCLQRGIHCCRNKGYRHQAIHCGGALHEHSGGEETFSAAGTVFGADGKGVEGVLVTVTDSASATGTATNCATSDGGGLVIVDSTINTTSGFTPPVNFERNVLFNAPAVYDVRTVAYGWTVGPAGSGFEGATSDTRLYAYDVLKGLLTCVDTASMMPCGYQ